MRNYNIPIYIIIELNRIEIVMSGGEYPHRVCVNLIVDDQVVRTATGRNDDLLDYVAFDVAALKGRQARIQVVDARRLVWGHINVDRIYQTNNSRAKRVVAAPPIGFGKAIGRVRTNAGDLRRGPLRPADPGARWQTDPRSRLWLRRRGHHRVAASRLRGASSGAAARHRVSRDPHA